MKKALGLVGVVMVVLGFLCFLMVKNSMESRRTSQAGAAAAMNLSHMASDEKITYRDVFSFEKHEDAESAFAYLGIALVVGGNVCLVSSAILRKQKPKLLVE